MDSSWLSLNKHFWAFKKKGQHVKLVKNVNFAFLLTGFNPVFLVRMASIYNLKCLRDWGKKIMDKTFSKTKNCPHQITYIINFETLGKKPEFLVLENPQKMARCLEINIIDIIQNIWAEKKSKKAKLRGEGLEEEDEDRETREIKKKSGCKGSWRGKETEILL